MPDNVELSERELEILQLVATGASNKEIAQALSISANTVKVHLRNIFAKIGVASRTEAAMFAVQHGLVATGPAEEKQLVEETEPAEDMEALPAGGQLRGIGRWLVLGILVVTVVVLGLVVYRLLPDALPANALPSSGPLPAEELSRWQERASLPQPRAGLAVAAMGEEVFVIGGELTNGVISSQVLIYHPEEDRWTELEPKPIPVADAQAVVLNGRIYVPGGRTGNQQITNQLEIFDPRLNRWEQGAELPEPLSAYALVAFEGRMYLFGGWDGAHYRADVLRYDPGADEWETLPSMHIERAFAGAATANQVIYVIGGRNENGPLKVNEIFDPALTESGRAAWQAAAPLPEARTAMGVESVVDIVYVLGGASSAGATENSLAYLPALDAWQTFPQPQVQRRTRMGVVLHGTQLYLIGGELDGEITAQMFSYQAIYTIAIPAIVK